MADTAHTTPPVVPVVPDHVTDAAGHRWAPAVDETFVRAAREIGVDVPRLVRREPGELLKAVTRNPRVTCGLLFQSVEAQAVAQSVSPAAFIRLVTSTGAVMGDMVALLLLAIARHYPASRFGRRALIDPRGFFHAGRGR